MDLLGIVPEVGTRSDSLSPPAGPAVVATLQPDWA